MIHIFCHLRIGIFSTEKILIFFGVWSHVQIEQFYKAYISAKDLIGKNIFLVTPDGQSHNTNPFYHKKFGWVLSKFSESAFLGKCNLTEKPTVKLEG